ncbi:MAG: hypothetical protein OEY93_02140 [Anaerolineae bacterium]|nr:hypothetical protein [Anaerolineae bacterium]
MSGILNPTDMVLVAFLPSPRDLEIARVLGWYRIPLRSAPKVVAVDHLAFYQPASFGEDHKWMIEYFAPVRGHELTTREDLFKNEADSPKAHEEYFKIQLGPVTELPAPVIADAWKRVTFLYTTGQKLMSAETINQLTVHDEERDVLWRALRERAQASQEYAVADLPEFPVDPEIAALFGFLGGGASQEE